MLDPVLGIRSPSPFILFAVLATAWYGGVGPSLTALALGALGADYFLLTPRGTFDLADEDMVVLVLYCITGLGISLLAGRMHRARSRAEDAAEALARGARLLDQTHDAIHTWDWAGAITFGTSAPCASTATPGRRPGAG